MVLGTKTEGEGLVVHAGVGVTTTTVVEGGVDGAGGSDGGDGAGQLAVVMTGLMYVLEDQVGAGMGAVQGVVVVVVVGGGGWQGVYGTVVVLVVDVLQGDDAVVVGWPSVGSQPVSGVFGTESVGDTSATGDVETAGAEVVMTDVVAEV